MMKPNDIAGMYLTEDSKIRKLSNRDFKLWNNINENFQAPKSSNEHFETWGSSKQRSLGRLEMTILRLRKAPNENFEDCGALQSGKPIVFVKYISF
jgi:hypothetical protein